MQDRPAFSTLGKRLSLVITEEALRHNGVTRTCVRSQALTIEE
jgi:hypothetical protein